MQKPRNRKQPCEASPVPPRRRLAQPHHGLNPGSSSHSCIEPSRPLRAFLSLLPEPSGGPAAAHRLNENGSECWEGGEKGAEGKDMYC